MNNNNKSKSGPLAINAVLSFGLAIILKVADSSTMFRYKVASTFHCDPDIINVFFWICICLGIFELILAIAMASSSQNSSNSNNISNNNNNNNYSGSRFIHCPKCGEANGLNNKKCFHCGTQLQYDGDPNHTVPNNSEWKCPKCGRINQNYVGTCGCGEEKK